MTLHKFLFTSLIVLYCFTYGNAQVTYGIQFQAHGSQKTGFVEADSILVLTRGGSSSEYKFNGIQTVGLFVEYHPILNFPLLLRSEINYRSPSYIFGIDILYVNTKPTKYGQLEIPTFKSLGYSVDIPIDISYALVKSHRILDFELGLIAGVAINFQSRLERETYPIGQAVDSQGISDVNFAFYNTIRTKNYFYNYGVRFKIGRIIALYRRDLLLTQSATNDLNVWGNTYAFRSNWIYNTISIGYTLHWFDKKSKIDDK